MSARRDLACPRCGPVTAYRIAMLSVLCPRCRTVVSTCAGCGGMTLARVGGVEMRCRIDLCGYRREMRADEIAALAAFEGTPRRAEPAPPPPKDEPRRDTFTAPPMMPAFRKGAIVAVGKKPAAYVPPKQKGAR